MLSVSMIIVKRTKPLPKLLIPILALGIGILLGLTILYVVTSGRINVLGVLISIGEALITPQLLLKNWALLTIVGVGLLISFKAAIWNIGGEGQFYLAIVAATWVALYSGLGALPIINKLLMITLGFLAAGLWALIASLPRGFLGVDEVPVTLMLNYVAYYIVDYLVYYPWREPMYRYARTPTIPSSAWFTVLPGTSIVWEMLILAIIVLVFAWFLYRYTVLGLYLKVMGSNPNVLRVVGVNTASIVVIALTLSGMVVGLAGVSYLAGHAHLITIPAEDRTPNLGYTGILVAWLSMLELIFIPFIAYIMSALIIAGINMQISGVGGNAVVELFTGTILLTYAVLIILTEYRIVFIVKRR